MNTLKNILLLLFLLLINSNAIAQTDCGDALIVCGNSGFTGLTVSGFGAQELDSATTCGSDENNSIWMKLNIKTSGVLGFVLTPETTDISEDFDFFIFGPNVFCGSLGTSIRCSTTNPQAARQGNNLTGMNTTETDVSEGPAANGNSFVKSLDVLAGESYFLVIDRPVGNSNFSIQWTGTATFFDPPNLPNPSATVVDLEQCDLDGVPDSSTPFDLTQNTPIMIGSQTNVMVTYHTTSNDAITGYNEILTPNSFPNTSNPQTIYARITNISSGCFEYTNFTISIKDVVAIPLGASSICDDAADGNDANGLATFHQASINSDIFDGEDFSNLTINYYLSSPAANAGTGALPLAFSNTSNPQTVYIKATNSSGCYLIKPIVLTVNPLPAKKTLSLTQCDTGLNPDGLTLFNLAQITPDFLNNDPNLSLAYYLNTTDALNNQDPLADNYTNISNPQNLVVKITDAVNGCSSLSTLTLISNTSPGSQKTIEACDNPALENGLTTFDLNQSNFVLSGSETIAYYVTLQDAILEQNPITTVAAYPNTNAYSQTIYARIESGNSCTSINTVNLVVNKLPNIKTTGDGDDYVCLNLPAFYIPIDAGILQGVPSDYNYAWTHNGTPLAMTTYTIQVNLPGTYVVKVTNSFGCFKTRTIEVLPSNIAVIEDIVIQDATTDNNTVTVLLTAASTGNYGYSLDKPDGPFQASNMFEGVVPGIHDVYVTDSNGCGTVTQQVTVMGIPHYFTPNGDGYNDYWNIQGTTAQYNGNSIIYIYNRFGKLLKQITPSGLGWDGTYNGKLMPADDYWYNIQFEDGRNAKGHFALKR